MREDSPSEIADLIARVNAHVAGAGRPYDNVEPVAPPALLEGASSPVRFSRELNLTDSGHPSGMMRRFLEEHRKGYWEHARAFRDPQRSPFNDVGIEDTKLWGDTIVFSWNQAVGNTFTANTPTNFKVFRQRPTTFTLTYTLLLVSPSWKNEAGNSTITVNWQIGVGQIKTILARTVTFVGSANFIDGVATPLSDTINVPAMGITARGIIGGTNNQQTGQDHVAVLSVLASPFVQ